MRREILWLSLGLFDSAPPTILCKPMRLTSPKKSGSVAVMVKNAQWVDYYLEKSDEKAGLKKVTSEKQDSAS
jgi:hypothetical protein